MKRIVLFWHNKMSHPIRGVKNGLLHDFSISYMVCTGIVGLILLYLFFGPFSALEQLLLIFCFFLMVMMEFVNSAFEAALDRLHPEKHGEIGYSKDLIAAASFCAQLFSLICIGYVLSGTLS